MIAQLRQQVAEREMQFERANAALLKFTSSPNIRESGKGEAALKAQMDMANLRVMQAQSKAQDAEAALGQTTTGGLSLTSFSHLLIFPQELEAKSKSLAEAQILVTNLYTKLKKAMEELKRLREGNTASDDKASLDSNHPHALLTTSVRN
jgi:hypothetical protein